MSIFDFDEYRYLYPPRPENACSPEQIESFNARGFCGQIKKKKKMGHVM
jgi:hypothetical protein